MSEKKGPIITVIIPVYNCERYLREAVRSILAQTYRPLEVILIDDGSTDKSAEVAKEFAGFVRYFYQKNDGAGAARNRGAELAVGDFLSFLDADDVWIEGKLVKQLAVFNEDPKVDMVFGKVEQFVSPELDDNTKLKIHCPAEIMPGYLPGAMLIKRKAFFRVGPFETRWKLGEFVDWYLKAMEKGLKGFMLSDIVLKRRLHDGNIGIRERDFRTDYVKIVKAALDRRRKREASA